MQKVGITERADHNYISQVLCVARLSTRCLPVVTTCTTSFNTQKCYVLPTWCICVFCMDLRTNSEYFSMQH